MALARSGSRDCRDCTQCRMEPRWGRFAAPRKQPTCPGSMARCVVNSTILQCPGWCPRRSSGTLRCMKVWPGTPYPLGATWDGAGVNFALFSEHATGVELCAFGDASGNREVARVRLEERDDQVWHCYLPEARPGF